MIEYSDMEGLGISPPRAGSDGERYISLVEEAVKDAKGMDDEEFERYVSETLYWSEYIVYTDTMWSVFVDLRLYHRDPVEGMARPTMMTENAKMFVYDAGMDLARAIRKKD